MKLLPRENKQKSTRIYSCNPFRFSPEPRTPEYCNYGARFITAGMYHMSATLQQGFKTRSRASRQIRGVKSRVSAHHSHQCLESSLERLKLFRVSRAQGTVRSSSSFERRGIITASDQYRSFSCSPRTLCYNYESWNYCLTRRTFPNRFRVFITNSLRIVLPNVD